MLPVDKTGDNIKTTLFHPLIARPGPPVGQPIAIVSNRKLLLAALANRLGWWSNVVADDFVDRFAGWAEIEKVIHCHVPYRGTPSVSIDNN